MEVQRDESVSLLKRYPKESAAITLLLMMKLAIVILLPVTGDEAYFVKWGDHLASGYYDHPPMVGWLIFLMNFIARDIVVYRMFSFFTSLVLAYLIYLFAKENLPRKRAEYTALIFLASPVDLLMSLFTNDIPLVLFGTVGAYLFYLSLEREKWARYAFGAGVFLGAAFLSKYFAAFLMLSLAGFAFVSYGKRVWRTVVLSAAAVLPFVAQNLYFNYMHCWNNIMFNFFSRPKSAFDPKMVGVFVAITVYLFTPWGLWMLRKAEFNSGKIRGLIVSVLGLAFTVFFIVSLKNEVGLHWFLLFLPYMYLLFAYLDEERQHRLFRYNFIFAAVHGAVLVTILLLPLSLFEKNRSYASIVYAVSPEAICKRISHYDDDTLFTMGYTSAAMLSYACDREIKMLFNTSKYGRMDDVLTDAGKLDGRDITIFRHKPIAKEKLLKACESVEVESFEVRKATFYLATCRRFSYKKYKRHFIEPLFRSYYNIPSWLPQGKCYMKEKYQER